MFVGGSQESLLLCRSDLHLSLRCPAITDRQGCVRFADSSHRVQNRHALSAGKRSPRQGRNLFSRCAFFAPLMHTIRRSNMLWTIFVILLVLWLLGFSLHIAGGLID